MERCENQARPSPQLPKKGKLHSTSFSPGYFSVSKSLGGVGAYTQTEITGITQPLSTQSDSMGETSTLHRSTPKVNGEVPSVANDTSGSMHQVPTAAVFQAAAAFSKPVNRRSSTKLAAAAAFAGPSKRVRTIRRNGSGDGSGDGYSGSQRIDLAPFGIQKPASPPKRLVEERHRSQAAANQPTEHFAARSLQQRHQAELDFRRFSAMLPVTKPPIDSVRGHLSERSSNGGK